MIFEDNLMIFEDNLMIFRSINKSYKIKMTKAFDIKNQEVLLTSNMSILGNQIILEEST